MESLRMERERRDSAKTIAAETLPSTQDKEFHLRLIDLYAQRPCLWNTALGEYQDAEMKRLAWEEITSELGAHLTPSLVRSRISSMRYRLNVYKLQTIEYKMSPEQSKQPEKLYFFDKFGFLDEANSTRQQLELLGSEHADDGSDLAAKKSSLSIANIFKQRMEQQQQHLTQLPDVLQRLSQSEKTGRGAKEPSSASPEGSSDNIISSVVEHRRQQSVLLTRRTLRKIPESLLTARRMLHEAQQEKPPDGVQPRAKSPRQSRGHSPDITQMLKKRMHRLGLAELGAESKTSSFDSLSDLRDGLLNIPSVVRKRMRQHLPLGTTRVLEAEQSSGKQPPTPEPLQAQPGESVSMTRMSKQLGQPKPTDSDEPLSEDEELYRLHWSVRQQQQRSSRPTATSPIRDVHPQPVPPLLLGISLTASAPKANK